MLILDTKKLLCPLPVIRLGEAMLKAKIGDEITILASDYGVLHDIPAWCNVHNQEVLSIDDGDVIKIVVKKIE